MSKTKQYAYNSYQAGQGAPIKPKMVFRQTPKGQPDLTKLIGIGTIVSTNYGSGPYCVAEIHEVTELGYKTHSLVCRMEKGGGNYFINELVAINNRILRLFGNNDDEVFVLGGGQLSLF